jgi:Leucine-rich repeat (LRR) protein
MSNNVITSFHPDTLQMVSELRKLDLSWNAMKYIQPQTFNTNAHLTFVDISQNRISDIDPRMFLQNPNITEFRIQHNKLDFINDEPILLAPSLKYLYLDFCNINYLPVKAFQKVANLKKLSLSNNKLVKFDRQIFELSPGRPILAQNIFSGLKQLEELDLSYNQFTFLDTKQFDDLVTLKRLHIPGNPFECNCNLGSLRAWCLKQHVDTGNVLCNDESKSSWDVLDSMPCISTTTTVSWTSSSPTGHIMPTKALQTQTEHSSPKVGHVTPVICTILAVVVLAPLAMFLWRYYRPKRAWVRADTGSQDDACLIPDNDSSI